MPVAGVTHRPPRWRTYGSLAVSLAGLGDSIYLTVDHFGRIPLACSDSGLVNCAKVTTSAQSYFLGVPVAVLGLGFFVVLTALCLPYAWRSTDRRVHIARLVLSATGMLFVLYLVSAELLIIHSICLWCTAVHIATFLLFVLNMATVPALLGWDRRPLSDQPADYGQALVAPPVDRAAAGDRRSGDRTPLLRR